MTEPKGTRKVQREAAQYAEYEARWGMPHADSDRVDSPERMAYEAYQRGDRLFQVEIPVAWVQGYIGFGDYATRLKHGEQRDVLGEIEKQGWVLQHVSSSFVQTGSAATKRIGAHDGSTYVATHGALIGLYVFRRVGP